MLLLLLLPLASCYFLPRTDLINGRFRYKEAPYDGPATGMTQYFALWGINATLVELFKESPPTEVYTLKEDGTGYTVEALQGPEAGGSELFDLTWNKPTLIPTPLGSTLETTASLLAPNTIRIVLKAREEGITEVRTLMFTGIGIQKTTVASKPGKTFASSEVVVWTSLEERIDEDGQSAPLTYGYPLYFY